MEKGARTPFTPDDRGNRPQVTRRDHSPMVREGRERLRLISEETIFVIRHTLLSSADSGKENQLE